MIIIKQPAWTTIIAKKELTPFQQEQIAEKIKKHLRSTLSIDCVWDVKKDE